MSTARTDSHKMSTTDSVPQVRSLCVRLLLIVVGIQGITPDLNDLASSRAFLFLLPESRPSRLRQEEDDRWYGEVSRPARSEQNSVSRRGVERIREVGFAFVGSMLDTGMGRLISAASLMGKVQLFDLLCHLTC